MKQSLLLCLLLCLLLSSACATHRYSLTRPDGTKIDYSDTSLFSNSAYKGLVVDGTTKTTTNGLKITGSTTEPNAESITATGSALGELIGTAAKAAAKP